MVYCLSQIPGPLDSIPARHSVPLTISGMVRLLVAMLVCLRVALMVCLRVALMVRLNPGS